MPQQGVRAVALRVMLQVPLEIHQSIIQSPRFEPQQPQKPELFNADLKRRKRKIQSETSLAFFWFLRLLMKLAQGAVCSYVCCCCVFLVMGSIPVLILGLSGSLSMPTPFWEVACLVMFSVNLLLFPVGGPEVGPTAILCIFLVITSDLAVVCNITRWQGCSFKPHPTPEFYALGNKNHPST